MPESAVGGEAALELLLMDGRETALGWDLVGFSGSARGATTSSLSSSPDPERLEGECFAKGVGQSRG